MSITFTVITLAIGYLTGFLTKTPVTSTLSALGTKFANIFKSTGGTPPSSPPPVAPSAPSGSSGPASAP